MRGATSRQPPSEMVGPKSVGQVYLVSEHNFCWVMRCVTLLQRRLTSHTISLPLLRLHHFRDELLCATSSLSGVGKFSGDFGSFYTLALLRVAVCRFFFFSSAFARQMLGPGFFSARCPWRPRSARPF